MRDRDGRIRIVHYIADEHGFRATIESNEPGVDQSQSPASVAFTNGHQMPSPAHIPVHHEPVAAAHAEMVHHSPSYVEPIEEPLALHKSSHVPAVHHASSHITPLAESLSHHEVSHKALVPHAPVPLAVSHSLPAPILSPAPLAFRNSHYEPEYHPSPAYQAVLAPLMNEAHIIPQHSSAPLYSEPIATPKYSHLQYVPEDGLHLTPYDGDFGRRFTPLKPHY